LVGRKGAASPGHDFLSTNIQLKRKEIKQRTRSVLREKKTCRNELYSTWKERMPESSYNGYSSIIAKAVLPVGGNLATNREGQSIKMEHFLPSLLTALPDIVREKKFFFRRERSNEKMGKKYKAEGRTKVTSPGDRHSGLKIKEARRERETEIVTMNPKCRKKSCAWASLRPRFEVHFNHSKRRERARKNNFLKKEKKGRCLQKNGGEPGGHHKTQNPNKNPTKKKR